jgi:hypothetical protein
MKLSALSGMVVFGYLAAIGRGADGAPDLIGPTWAPVTNAARRGPRP